MGAVGSGRQHILRPAPLPAAPIGRERRTVASGSCDRPNLRKLQGRLITAAANRGQWELQSTEPADAAEGTIECVENYSHVKQFSNCDNFVPCKRRSVPSRPSAMKFLYLLSAIVFLMLIDAPVTLSSQPTFSHEVPLPALCYCLLGAHGCPRGGNYKNLGDKNVNIVPNECECFKHEGSSVKLIQPPCRSAAHAIPVLFVDDCMLQQEQVIEKQLGE
ncbi:hypothetical protein UY3_08842 [Chelonia mydas]|uniref:Uncharacterized protein n=1 Tax=Chelonia mydas TaxID=8469 RepID=M7BPV0_CHEMY|nr:hypothetical protein UY3_08842 [Chelonia mydas]